MNDMQIDTMRHAGATNAHAEGREPSRQQQQQQQQCRHHHQKMSLPNKGAGSGRRRVAAAGMCIVASAYAFASLTNHVPQVSALQRRHVVEQPPQQANSNLAYRDRILLESRNYGDEQRHHRRRDDGDRKLGSGKSGKSGSKSTTWSSSSSTSWSSSSSKSSKSKSDKSKSGKSSSSGSWRSSSIDSEDGTIIPISTPQPTTSPPTLPPPTANPTTSPPTNSPTEPQPTISPSKSPSGDPTALPSMAPTVVASVEPSGDPTALPSMAPTVVASVEPSGDPTALPSMAPTIVESVQPSELPSAKPTISDSQIPTTMPSNMPTITASHVPTMMPSNVPSNSPTAKPSLLPSNPPSITKSESPSTPPTISISPTKVGTTKSPSRSPVVAPTGSPSFGPSEKPTASPVAATEVPTFGPTDIPTVSPSDKPTESPVVVGEPTKSPIDGNISSSPTNSPVVFGSPTKSPIVGATLKPSEAPIAVGGPTKSPSDEFPTFSPTYIPTLSPTGILKPTDAPSDAPSFDGISPTKSPSDSTDIPTFSPTYTPTLEPFSADTSLSPSVSTAPTFIGIPTSPPTVLTTIDTRPTLQVQLFGLDNDLSPSQMSWYQQRTADYIERFYNNPSGGGILDVIKNQVGNVRVNFLCVVEQEIEVPSLQPSSEPSLQPSFSSQPSIQPSSSFENGLVRAEDGMKMMDVKQQQEEDDESYLPEFAITNRRRHLQFTLQTTSVTEPCLGENPLTMTFELEISYQTTNPNLRGSDLVISFPFSNTLFRTEYINDYLKINDDGEIEEGFENLYCTSQVFFPDDGGGTTTNVPTETPTASNLPTSNPSLLLIPSNDDPSPSNAPSVSMMPSSSSMPSFSPSVSMMPSSSSMPSFSCAVRTTAPSVSSVPSSSSMPSIAPSISSVPSAPSVVQPPTSLSVIPTALPSTSSVPSISNIPSTSSDSDPPSTSNSPSISSIPSVSNSPSQVPSISLLPTTTVIIDPSLPKSNLQMKLYGLTSELTIAEEELWNVRTAAYMEYFYNEYTLNDGDMRGDVLDVVAEVDVTAQQQIDDDNGGTADDTGTPTYSPTYLPTTLIMRSSKITDDDTDAPTYSPSLSPTALKRRSSPLKKGADPGIKGDNDNEEDDEDFLPENAISDPFFLFGGQSSKKKAKKKKAMHHYENAKISIVLPTDLLRGSKAGKSRKLQDDDEVNTNCTGAALNLVFSITIEYRLRGNNTLWTIGEIINEPFSIAEYRDDYLNNFLKQPPLPQGLPLGQDVFETVTCTSEVAFPNDGEVEVPSMQPSFLGSTVAPTASPKPSGFEFSASPTLSPKPSDLQGGTLGPTLSSKPSIVQGTVGPTLSPKPSTNQDGTSSPTSSSKPSIQGEEPVPTSSPKPSIAQGTTEPTLSPKPSTNQKGITYSPTLSTQPSVLQGTAEPTSSPKPSTLEGITSPTLSPEPSVAQGSAGPTLSTKPSTVQEPTLSPRPSVLEEAGTSSPTLSAKPSTIQAAGTTGPTSSAGPTGAGSSISISPPLKTGLEMDLFGLLSLQASDQLRYAQGTASYIESFYNADDDAITLPTQGGGLQAIVSNVTASITVTDQLLPMGPTSGIDCSQIDPVSLTYTLQMTYYVSNNDDVDFDEIITFPFSTEQFQQAYINDYLKANDISGGFQDLQCVSQVRLPDGVPTLPTQSPVDNSETATPTASSVPSALPTVFVDDIFDLRSEDPSAYERKCHDTILATEKEEEFELSFLYGVESSSSTTMNFIIEDMESMILDFVATSVLRCSSSSNGVRSSVQFRERKEDAVGDDVVAGVVGIRYPGLGGITSISKCDSVSSQAKGCSVLNTKLLITTVGGEPTSDVHRDILTVLADAFEKDVFVEFIPELVTTSYLGPDPEAVTLSAETITMEGSGEISSSNTFAIIFSVSCIALLIKLMSCFASPVMRKRTLEKVVSYYRRKRQTPLPTCSGPAWGDELNGSLVPTCGCHSEKERYRRGRSEEALDREYGENDSKHLLH